MRRLGHPLHDALIAIYHLRILRRNTRLVLLRVDYVEFFPPQVKVGPLEAVFEQGVLLLAVGVQLLGLEFLHLKRWPRHTFFGVLGVSLGLHFLHAHVQVLAHEGIFLVLAE